MDNYSNASIELFKEWKEKEIHKKSIFIEDGIIEKDRWFNPKNQDKKILFFLKEAYGGEENWDLCSEIREEWKGPKYKIWWTVSYWAYAIQELFKGKRPVHFSEIESQKCSDYLLSSAIVNVKKSSGKSSSTVDNLAKYAMEDKTLLLKQIDLINPDIILCGYTKEYLPLEADKVENTDFIYKTKSGILIIDFWHPANQYPDNLCFYGLCYVLSNYIDSIQK